MVTCGGSQHWARRLQELGHEVSFGYQRRRGSGRWRGGTDRGVRDLRHQEPAGPYRAHPRTGEVVSISASVSPSLKAEKALRDAVNAGRRVVAVGWPQIPIWNATHTPDMETSRLRYDDGPSGLHSSIAGKSQCDRWVAGLAAAVMDTRLHMWQEYREPAST